MGWKIGRWLSPDPYGQYASSYLGMGNNPVSLTDPDGGCTKCPKNANVGDTYNHSEYGALTYNDSGQGEYWSDSSGMIIGDDALVSGQFIMPKADLLLIQGLASTANRLFDAPYDRCALDNLKDEDKLRHFKNSPEKTVAILMYEFGSGKGPRKRIFNEDSAISQNIKWFYSNNKAMNAFLSRDRVEDKWYNFYVPSSPDKTNLRNSILSTVAATRDMTFYFGGMHHMVKK